MQTVNITNQWQIYIPGRIRESLGWEKPGRVNMRVKMGKVIIEPVESLILKMGGFLEGAKPRKRVESGKERDIVDYSGL